MKKCKGFGCSGENCPPKGRARITDKMRLDWLSKHDAGMVSPDIKKGPSWIRQWWVVKRPWDCHPYRQLGLRQAIDAAIKHAARERARAEGDGR